MALLARKPECSAKLNVFLVDAGSTDGTAEMVASMFPEVNIVAAGSELYWSGAMRQAQLAGSVSSPDYFLWLNDDVTMFAEGISVLLATVRSCTANANDPAIVVGSTWDPDSGCVSYGGWRRDSRLFPLRLRRVEGVHEPTLVEAMNGNCVLVNASAAQALGPIDARFTHGMGDMDYAFRARRLGIPVWLAPGSVGSCVANAHSAAWRERQLPVVDRWRQLIGPKGLPPSEWIVFTRRHGGPLWWLSAAKPYVSFWAGVVVAWAFGRGRGVTRL
jgi:GT2 family glycosyltransferase